MTNYVWNFVACFLKNRKFSRKSNCLIDLSVWKIVKFWKKFKSFKKRKISFDIDNFEKENSKFKIAKTKSKKIKNINKINSNHESIKFKNIKIYRWFAIKFKKIQIKNNCIECDESNHQIEICTKKKEKIIFVDQIFEQSKKNRFDNFRSNCK